MLFAVDTVVIILLSSGPAVSSGDRWGLERQIYQEMNGVEPSFDWAPAKAPSVAL